MTASYHIHHLSRKQIDPGKWDDCINRAPGGLIYATVLYLDSMSHHWDALVLEDYQAVMPLCWNKKWGIRYLYHPPLTPQLGIFSSQAINKEMIAAFLTEAMRHFRFAEIFLNFTNEYPGLQPLTNIVLDLTSSYETISDNYKPDLIKNLKKTTQYQLNYLPSYDVDMAVSLYAKYYAARTPHVKPSDYRLFAGFCREAIQKDAVLIRTVLPRTNQDAGVPGPPNNPPLALALVLKYNGRLYLLMSVCPPSGRKIHANHFLLDNLIREFAGTGLVLDFDGSEIPGIAHFYRNFGGINQPFFFYRCNNLPWPLRLFKPSSTGLPSTHQASGG